jgi:23S rRNA (guanine745-N1)-methyltransferase
MITPANNFACPIDGSLLSTPPGQPWHCTNGHSFDVAREGYCNLLVVQHKASRAPGDTAEMVAARRRVLDTGIYAPIADSVVAHLWTLTHRPSLSVLPPSPPLEGLEGEGRGGGSIAPFRVVDAGCGEGYYLARIAELAAGNASYTLELAGTDVSKWAVRAAAKRKAPIAWAVANNRHLPFQAASVDAILCLFGFPVWQGFSPVLSPDGRVLMVDPGPEHLVELRAVIYPTVNRSPVASLQQAEAAGYVLESTTPVTYTANLTSQAQIADLFAMTPHAHRATEAGRAALQALDQLTVTVDVVVRQLRLASGQSAS